MSEWIECKHCDGIGEVDPTGLLDLDSIPAVLTELVDTATDAGPYGIRGTEAADRIRSMARVSFLASRLAWLESCELQRRQNTEKAKAKAEQLIADKIASGELVRVEGGGLIKVSGAECRDVECGLVDKSVVHVDH